MSIDFSKFTKDKKTFTLWVTTILLIIFALTFSFVQKSSSAQSNKERVNSITRQLRCLECEGLSVYDSETSISSAIKKEVSSKVKEGESSKDIIAGYVETYGEFIRLNPTNNDGNWAVFVFPIIAFIVLVIAIFVYTRKKSSYKLGGNIVVNIKVCFWVLVALAFSGTAIAYKVDISNKNDNVVVSKTSASEDPEALKKSLEAQVKLKPTNENYRALGIYQFAQEDYLSALKNLDIAVSLDSKDATSQAYASYIVLRAEQFESARQRADAAYDLDPNNISALFFRGLIYREVPTISDAQAAQYLAESNDNFDRVVQLDPDSEFAQQIGEIRS